MKKKFLKDKDLKTSFDEMKNYCIELSKGLDRLFEPFGHDHRDFERLDTGYFFR